MGRTFWRRGPSHPSCTLQTLLICARCLVEGRSSRQPSQEVLVGQAAVSLCPQAASEAPTGRGSHQELRDRVRCWPRTPCCLCTPSSDCRDEGAPADPPILNPPILAAGLQPLSQGERASSGHWRCRVRAPGQRPRPGPRLSVPVLGSSDLDSPVQSGPKEGPLCPGRFSACTL